MTIVISSYARCNEKILVSLSFLMPSLAWSCPSLGGTWLSLLEKFRSFNQRWANVEEKAWSCVLQTRGHEVITFSDDTQMTIVSPKMSLKTGEKTECPAATEQINLTLLVCTDTSVVLRYQR